MVSTHAPKATNAEIACGSADVSASAWTGPSSTTSCNMRRKGVEPEDAADSASPCPAPTNLCRAAGEEAERLVACTLRDVVSLYARAGERGDDRSALAVLGDAAKLQGCTRPRRRGTGPVVGGPNSSGVVAWGDRRPHPGPVDALAGKLGNRRGWGRRTCRGRGGPRRTSPDQ